LWVKARFTGRIPWYAVARLKFIDELSINITMTRCYGCAQRFFDAVLKNWDHHNAVLQGSLSCYGLEAVMTIESTTDTAACLCDTASRLCEPSFGTHP